MARTTSFFAILLVSGALASPAAGQVGCVSAEDCHAPGVMETGLRQELTVAGINAVLGGVSAAAVRLIRGEAVGDALWQGAIGGGVVYAGKRLTVEGFDGAGLAGRELASVGGSMVRNAGAGRGLLDELVFPIGPVRLYVSSERGIRPRVDVGTLVASASFVLAHGARLDVSESLSSGAMVFRGAAPVPGLSSAGAVVTWTEDRIPEGEGARLLAHERVHVLQYDQAFLSWDEAVERWLVGRSGRGTGFLSHLDFGALTLGLRSGLNFTVPYAARPWEREAYFLAQSAHPLAGEPGIQLH